MLKTRSGLYNKETGRLKSKIFSSDPVNHEKILKRKTLENVRKSKNSVIGVRNNGVTRGDLIESYQSDGIDEKDIRWGSIHADVLLEWECIESAKKVPIKIALKKKEVVSNEEIRFGR
jgi:hypothetical protein